MNIQEHVVVVGGVLPEGGKNTMVHQDQHANPPTIESQPSNTHTTPVSFSHIQAHWPAILRAIDKQSTSLTFIMKLSQPVSVEGNVMLLRFQYPFHRDKIISDIKTKHLVEDCIASVIGSSGLRIDGTVATISSPTQEAGNRDVVAKILTAFGGHVVEESDGRIGS